MLRSLYNHVRAFVLAPFHLLIHYWAPILAFLTLYIVFTFLI